MIVVWGSRLYGKVDEVPGLFYVATKFGHLWYIPLIPLGSTLVFRETENGWEGVKIPLSGKSVLIAWLRAGLVLSAIATGVGIIGSLASSEVIGAVTSAIGLGIAVGLFWFTKKAKVITTCDLPRAKDLAQKAGLSDEVMQLLEAQYMAMPASNPIQPG
jgi:hypothetical protein